MENYKKCKIELLQLKIQTTYDENTVKDTEAESIVLRKRLRKVEDNLQRSQKLLGESLAARRDLKRR